jgi:hypothetical protein
MLRMLAVRIWHISDRHLPVTRARDHLRGQPINPWDVFAAPRVPSQLDTNFQTPPWCCRYMVSLIPPGCCTVLEPTPGTGNLVQALGGYEVTMPVGDFWIEIEPARRFDAVVMNPPCSPPSRAYKFLMRCMTMSDHIIALMPWVTIINSDRRTNLIREFGLMSITHLSRSVFPGSRMQCCILQMRRGYLGETTLHFLDRPRPSDHGSLN